MQEPYAAYRVVNDSGISGNDNLNSLIDKVLGEQKPEPSSKEIY
ncbi:MAG: hypothetical protein PHT32_01005 [Candidatus Omnitrophica bacterium]|nr:hypothetical protein [Candidatus Omnitrophota bacterium]